MRLDVGIRSSHERSTSRRDYFVEEVGPVLVLGGSDGVGRKRASDLNRAGAFRRGDRRCHDAIVGIVGDGGH